MSDAHNPQDQGGRSAATYTVLLYSHDPAVRDRIRLAIGPRPAADLTVEFVDAATWEECRRLLDDYEIDLMVLDGEAQPAGGLGIARQTKDEYPEPPPICVVIARAADRWLAAFAQVDATLVHPLDPMTTGQSVAGMLRGRRDGVVPRGTIGTIA
jgi:DNA-binding response OmpR family regulator